MASADQKSYMHNSFPGPKDNEHTAHLKHMHNVSTQDPALRGRTEQHSVPQGGTPAPFISGHGNR